VASLKGLPATYQQPGAHISELNISNQPQVLNTHRFRLIISEFTGCMKSW
jgi:hypothetical protein